MNWPSWLKLGRVRKPVSEPSPTQCPKCGSEMIRIEKNTMSGRDLRTYRCEYCQEEHDLDFGVAMWTLMSDANKSDN
jgi:predicted RNA-binding Zn-ribbon protein involved in translation (DUF1610 family)